MKIIHDKLKVHSLTGRITEELMLKSFKAVKKNRGAAGIDRVSIAMYESNLSENLPSLMRELKRGLYKPKPLRRVHIPKGNGKTRPLGIPTVKCRIAQEVLRRLINPIFESRFHDNSFGFRPGRNCHQAVERMLQLSRQGYRFVVDVDIKGFFDNISHRVLRGMVNYFGTKFSTMKYSFTELDKWIRRRIRCMKCKRISQSDNLRIENTAIKKMGLLSCNELYRARLRC